jgi:hypothetical protein
MAADDGHVALVEPRQLRRIVQLMDDLPRPRRHPAAEAEDVEARWSERPILKDRRYDVNM